MLDHRTLEHANLFKSSWTSTDKGDIVDNMETVEQSDKCWNILFVETFTMVDLLFRRRTCVPADGERVVRAWYRDANVYASACVPSTERKRMSQRVPGVAAWRQSLLLCVTENHDMGTWRWETHMIVWDSAVEMVAR